LLGHAEINCILKAERKLKDWRLDGCEMFLTLAPCDMCEIHIRESRINEVHFLLNQGKTQTLEGILKEIRGNFELKEEYKTLLKKFFENLRK